VSEEEKSDEEIEDGEAGEDEGEERMTFLCNLASKLTQSGKMAVSE
jgi:hypothetical protein